MSIEKMQPIPPETHPKKSGVADLVLFLLVNNPLAKHVTTSPRRILARGPRQGPLEISE
jgi:hypothetical protein